MNEKYNDLKQIIIIFLINIINSIILFVLPFECPWKKIFDIDCAGCGTTRMLKEMFNLNFYQAFRYNPLIFILLILIILYIIYCFICLILKKKIFKLGFKFLIILTILLFIYTIIRNIDMFNYLKPTIIN